MNLMELIMKLKDEDNLTQGEAKRLPHISNALPANNVWANEKTIAVLPLEEIRWLLKLEEKFYSSKKPKIQET